MKKAISWFEIPVEDMARAKKFYEHVMDVQLVPGDPIDGMEMACFPMKSPESSASDAKSFGARVKYKHHTPSKDGVVLYLSSQDLEVELGRIDNSGGKVVSPRTSIGKWGYMAYFIDTEGNKLALHSSK